MPRRRPSSKLRLMWPVVVDWRLQGDSLYSHVIAQVWSLTALSLTLQPLLCLLSLSCMLHPDHFPAILFCMLPFASSDLSLAEKALTFKPGRGSPQVSTTFSGPVTNYPLPTHKDPTCTTYCHLTRSFWFRQIMPTHPQKKTGLDNVELPFIPFRMNRFSLKTLFL